MLHMKSILQYLVVDCGQIVWLGYSRWKPAGPEVDSSSRKADVVDLVP